MKPSRPSYRLPLLQLSQLTRFYATLALAATIFCCSSDLNADDVGAQIESQTGAHTRVVWVQDQSRAQNDTLARGRSLLLMGLDSRDGKGERTILRGARNYVKPLLTPTGDRIVYSDHFQNRIFVVDWDGRNRRALGPGFALDVWQDPADGTEWVYAAIRAGSVEEFVYRDVFRIRLDGPRVREPVWNKTLISPDNFQLSADGRKAAGVFPWPNSGVADLNAKTWDKRATGCWASMAPDNSYVCSIFDGPHRNLQLHSSDGSRTWKVNVAPVDLFEGFEVFHPRWSNHVRFLALTGPYKVEGPVNEISGGGPEVEVYLAKFSEDFDQIESWVRVTNNQRGDFYPDVWIADGQQTAIPDSVSGRNQAPSITVRQEVNESDGQLVFLWDAADRQNEVPGNEVELRTCRIEPRGYARFDSFFTMRCGTGFFEIDQSSTTAIQSALADDDRFSLEVLITPEEILDSQQTKTVLQFGEPSGNRIAVRQKRNNLEVAVFNSNFSSTVQVANLKAGELVHLLITSNNGQIEIWSDGKAIATKNLPALVFKDYDSIRIVLGADLEGTNPWRGRLERLRFYRQPLTSAEVASARDSAHTVTRERIFPIRSLVQAEWVQSTPVPSPESILPYRRALLTHHFRLKKVLEGEFTEQEFLVARWGILDGQTVEGDKPEPGELVELLLESFDAQPQLASERQFIEVDRFELPMFYDVSFPF